MNKKILIRITAVLFFLIAVLPFSSCTNGGWLKIDVPQETQEGYVGTYEIPEFIVRNTDGEIMLGHDVYVKNVKNSKGKKVQVENGGLIDVEEPSVYTITYASDGVKDAKMKVKFVYAPPTVSISQNALPESYVSGQWYDIPSFRLGDAVFGEGKTTVKLFHQLVEGGERTEIPVSAGFMASEPAGYYVWVIHAVNNKGAAKDYEYKIRAEQGPSLAIPGKIAYFDQELGNAQIGSRGGVVTNYDREQRYGNESGSLRAVFPGPHPVKTFVYLKIVRPWEADITDYDYLVMRVYNVNDYDIWYFWDWFAYTKCPSKQWTEIVWDMRKPYQGRTGLPFSACMSPHLAEGLNITSIDMHFFVQTPTNEANSPFTSFSHTDTNIPFKNGIHGQVLPKNSVVNLSAAYAVKFRSPNNLTTVEDHTAATGYRGGPLSQGMSLRAGYTTTSTDEFTIGDYYTVEKISGNEKITWNSETNKIDIASGLAAGSYPTEFDILDEEGHSVMKYNFTVTVG